MSYSCFIDNTVISCKYLLLMVSLLLIGKGEEVVYLNV